MHQETKRVRNIIRFGRDMNPPVYKYSYVTDQFILGCLQGGILQPIQQHTWDVTFVSEKPNNTIFSLHPFVSGKELADTIGSAKLSLVEDSAHIVCVEQPESFSRLVIKFFEEISNG